MMSGTEQVLVLVGAPALIVLVIWALASIGGPQAKKRYRPGRPYEFTPVWYLANHSGADAGLTPLGNDPASARELRRSAAESSVGGATGGASDRW